MPRHPFLPLLKILNRATDKELVAASAAWTMIVPSRLPPFLTASQMIPAHQLLGLFVLNQLRLSAPPPSFTTRKAQPPVLGIPRHLFWKTKTSNGRGAPELPELRGWWPSRYPPFQLPLR
jgi:hypothetical protein